jgi:cell wall-associated NlpC family hydrolase
MPHGICHLSLVPVRSQADESAEMCTQLLYGEHFTILEQRKHYSRIRIASDSSEGWVCNRQFRPLEETDFRKIEETSPRQYATDLVAFASTPKDVLIPVLLGSQAGMASLLGHHFEGELSKVASGKPNLAHTAMLYLNAPFLSGGLSPFGIDSAGLTQMVYRLNGMALLRKPADQATQGEALSFIEESEVGDLAFFDNKEGQITHVGIILKDNHIIHAHGKVRIDRLDHTGIFNTELGLYSHQLRVIKKMQ